MRLIKNNKSFRALFLSSLFTMLGNSLLNIVFLIYASTYSKPSLYVSLAELFVIAPIVLSAYTGYLADKTPQKARVMVKVSLLQALLYLSLTGLFLARQGWSSFLGITLIKFSTDLLSGYKNGLRAPILRENLQADEIGLAFGQLQGLGSIIEIIGQPLGVLILTLSGQSYFVVGLVNGLLYLASGSFILGFIKYLKTKPSKQVLENQKFAFKKTLEQIRVVFTVESRKVNFLVILLAVILLNFLFSGLTPVIDLALVRQSLFDLPYSTSLLLFNISLSVGMLLGSLFMKDFLQKIRLLRLLLMIFLFISLFSVSFIKLPLLSLLLIFIMAYVIAKASPKVNTLIMENIAPENLGKISGSVTTLFTFSIPFGGGCFLFLANIFGSQFTLYLISAISFLMLLLLTTFSRKHSMIG